MILRRANTGVIAITNRLATEQWSPAGASVFRIGFGVAALLYYLTNYSDRHYFWGPDAVFPDELFRSGLDRPAFSLYEFATTNVGFELIFHLGVVVAVAFTLGLGGRWLTALHYLFLYSIYLRNPVLLDGGDNLAFIVLLMMIPADLRRHLAVRPSQHRPGPAATVVHNAAILAAIAQLCVMYLVSGLNKVQGQMWQDGTAFYYVMKVPEYSWPAVTDHIVTNAPLIVAVTYFTVFFQVLFPALIISPRLRPFAVAIGVTFHAGIAMFMGLVVFAIYMIATEALLLKDSHYAWLTHGKLGDRPTIRSRDDDHLDIADGVDHDRPDDERLRQPPDPGSNDEPEPARLLPL